MTTRFCERCQKDVARFGIHSCVRTVKASASLKAPPAPGLAPDIEAAPSPRAVKNADPSPNAVNAAKNASPLKTSTARTQRWRDANPQKARAYIREYMRKRRAFTASA